MKNKTFKISIVLLLLLATVSTASSTFAQTNKHTQKVTKRKVQTVSKNSIPTATAALDISGHTYTVQVTEGTTLYDAMVTLQNTKNSMFTFHSKNYPGLGNFIDEINGIKGTPGKYWIYSVHSVKPSVGVSTYLLKNGDYVSWKQEGF